MTKGIFDGVKVVDFGWIGVGPLVATALGLYGATVVRVESTHRLDMLRTAPPHKDGIAGVNRSGFFAYNNVNKYGFALNLKGDKALSVARRLVAWADVVTNSFTAGTFEKLGLSYEELVKIKPDIILYRTCNQGLTGPHAAAPGFGSQLVGLAGFTNLTGWTDREPVQPFGAYTDFIAQPLGVAAVVGALAYKRKTGKGQLIDLSQLEASTHFLSPVILDYETNNREEQRMGNAAPDAAPHGAYQCKGDDRWVAIAVCNDKEWKAFCKVIGKPAWTKDPRFATILQRKANEDELNTLVEQWTKTQVSEDVMYDMQAAGVPAGIVSNAADQWKEPIRDWGAVAMLEHHEIGVIPHKLPEYELSKSPPDPRMPSPLLGEHTEMVCKEFLGMSDEEFIGLLAEGIFE